MVYPRWLFDAELGVVIASLLCLWPLYALQLLVWRFSPRKKWVDTKVATTETQPRDAVRVQGAH